ncbi:MAG TPA: winged helix-turn-helix domain-containing protein, partial [Blastocatellia bacterium]|nr:winged helix-turn-helix domain-containing protein [Blastocatellia bacterium]
KDFDMLRLLVQSSGHLISKDALMQAVWPDSFVEEVNLNRSISTLRRALGDSPARPRYIETVPRHGYRFIAPVTVAADGGAGPPQAVAQKDSGAAREIAAPPAPEAGGSVEKRAARGFKRRAAMLAGALVLPLAAAVYFAVTPQPAQPAGAATRPEAVTSLAVLPFMPLGATTQDDLGLRLTDALITRLCRAEEFSVRPTSAVLRYKGTASEAVAAGQALKVDAVLEGSVQEVEGRIRVTARLLSVKEGEPLWSGVFDAPTTDRLKVQDALAEQVTAKLALELHDAASAEAQELYRKGRYHINQRTWSHTNRADSYFQQAIEKDPNFALAYVGMAEVRTLSGYPASLVEPLLDRAFALDGNLGEAWAAWGFSRMFLEWKWDEAEADLKRAIELSPQYVTAYQWYALLLAITGRLDEAKVMMRRGLEIEPYSHNLLADMGQLHYFAREYEEAIAACHRALEVNPDFGFAHGYLSLIYEKQGDLEKALEAYGRGGMPEAEVEAYKERYRGSGIKGILRDRVDEESKKYSKREFASNWYHLASWCALLGEKKQALEWLEKAQEQGPPGFAMPFVGADPAFDDLRAEPRFQDLLRRMRLAP